MQKWAYLILFVFGLVLAVLAGILMTNPGYFDSYYYFYGGNQIASGAGFQEDFLWNYLADPVGIPYPSHAYWMPLTSLMSALGIKLFGGLMPKFEAAQLVFIVVAACIPPLTAALSFAISEKRKFAWLSGILVGFPGLYMPFMTTTDGFALTMVIGTIFFLAFLRLKRWRYVGLGLLAGLMHLTRADGLIWLGVVFAVVVIDKMEGERFTFREVFEKLFTVQFVRAAAVGVVGYLAVMLPWYLRNLNVFGSLMPPGNGRAMWVLVYDELYSFPASILTPQRWWAAGLGKILLARGESLVDILKTNFFSMGGILPGLLSGLGAWRHRGKKLLWLSWVVWGTLTFLMTLVFPFSAMRGSYLHSGAALVPMIYALTPVGLDMLTKASLRRFKSWEDRKIRPFYTAALVLFAVGFSINFYFSALIGDTEDTEVWGWNEKTVGYAAVEEALLDYGAQEGEGVITSSSPAFVMVTGRPSYNVPDGGVETVLALAHHYDLRWVLVENTHPEELEDLFEDPHDVAGLDYLGTFEGIHLFRVEDE